MPEGKPNPNNVDTSKDRDIPRGDKEEQSQADAEDRISEREDASQDMQDTETGNGDGRYARRQ